MVLATRKDNGNSKIRIINIGGDDIVIMHVGFEVSQAGWEKFQDKMQEHYGKSARKVKSRAMRILVNATNLGIINLKDLEDKIEKAAENVKDVVYL